MYKDCICPPSHRTSYEAAKILCPLHGDPIVAQTLLERQRSINDVQVHERTPSKLWYPNTHFGECGQSCPCCRALNPKDSSGCCPLPHKFNSIITGICTHYFIIGIRRTSKYDENDLSDDTPLKFRAVTNTSNYLGRKDENAHTSYRRPGRIRRHCSSPGERLYNKIESIRNSNGISPVKRKAVSSMNGPYPWDDT